jgi:hypothetical protein
MTRPRARHPARLLHRCCANAAANLVAHLTQAPAELGVYSWKLIAEPRVTTYPPTPGRMLSIIHCPWCGENLERWRLARPNPLDPNAETLEESDMFLSGVLRELRRRDPT